MMGYVVKCRKKIPFGKNDPSEKRTVIIILLQPPPICKFLPLEEAIASRAVIVIVSRVDRQGETLLELANELKNGKW